MNLLKYLLRVLGVMLCFIALPSKAEAPENDWVKTPYFVVKAITKVAESAEKIIENSQQAVQAVGDKTILAEKATLHRMREILQRLTPQELADPKSIALPLQKTEVQVQISGVIADVTVTQVYKNTGKLPVEGTYVFAGSSRSAVYGMSMTIGDRVYEAKIKEKKEAQEIYKKAKEEGKKTALLEEEINTEGISETSETAEEFDLYPKTKYFKMNVANILPNDEVKVQLKYTELLIPTDGKYRFFYPTPTSAKYDTSISEGEEIPENNSFEMNVNLQAGMNIQDTFYDDTYEVSAPDKSSRIIKATSNKKDFIFDYRLMGEAIETGILLHEGKEENFFLAMIQPPKRPSFDAIPAREYIFVVDVSGSMSGFPLKTAKELMQNLLKNVRLEDRFNVLLFAGASDVFQPKSVPTNPKNLNKALNFMDKATSGGNTDLHSALERILKIPASENYSRNVVIITDGAIHFPAETYELIQKSANQFNFFPFGIGALETDVETKVIRSIAIASNTVPFLVTSNSEAVERAETFKNLIQTPVLTNLKAEFSGIDVYDIEPMSLPDIFKNRPVLIFGKWNKNGTSEAKGKVTISGISDKRITLKNTIPKSSKITENSALSYLWARKRIEHLSNMNELSPSHELEEKITELGLKYNLLTKYTSFVAVEEEDMLSAKKTNSGAVPEPEEWLLILVLLSLALFLVLKRYFSLS